MRENVPESVCVDKSYLCWCDEALIKKKPATFAPFHSAKTQTSSAHALQVARVAVEGKLGPNEKVIDFM